MASQKEPTHIIVVVNRLIEILSANRPIKKEEARKITITIQ